MTARRTLPAAAAALLLLAGCGTSFTETLAAEDTPAATPSSAPPEDGDGDGDEDPSCPAERAEPDPDRPVVDLDFRLSDDRQTVTGTETVVFTPDVATDEMVFRLVPNGPGATELGNRITVDDVRGDDVDQGGYEDAGAEGPGGLYVLQLDGELGAGESTEVELDFTVSLGGSGFERLGTAEDVSWWASGFPLLAWEPGVGWARDPFVGVLGETASSPVADTTVTVSAPEDLTVLMTGAQDEPTEPDDGRRTWTAHEPVARDVSVAAGEFRTATLTSPGGVEITTGVLPGSGTGPGELADWASEDVTELADRFGAFPYATLTVPLLPDEGGGIEYPSSILLAGADRSVLEHEVAHMWFYGMVGDSQFRDPWLDEAFATYAERVDGQVSQEALDRVLAGPGDVGAAMDEFADTGAYFDAVYDKGGAALVAAREAAGPAPFDAALRCYVQVNAWSIATPADLAAALADLPAATDVLVAAGALDEDDLPD
ncbi:peptidase M1-like protein [Geodermatophilus normandii]|uniref:Peptidase M1-like protein n=1 Tax=Geodermatophilus normandii TaxID=1137989 RepID=A0A317QJ57_9ACTN|nr:M1 family aminopeptidase [Geodermatophilus normandii]PWW22736.1 peptidase M1-like protein [Geodermatophilus normandii]